MKKGTKDIVSGAVLLVLAIAMLSTSLQIKKVTPIGVSSGFVPALVAMLLAAISLIIIFNGYRALQTDSAKRDRLLPSQLGTVLGTFFAIGIYVFCLGAVGFLVSTFVYLVAQIGILSPPRERHWLKFAAISGVVTAVVYYVFLEVFDLLLPVGILG